MIVRLSCIGYIYGFHLTAFTCKLEFVELEEQEHIWILKFSHLSTRIKLHNIIIIIIITIILVIVLYIIPLLFLLFLYLFKNILGVIE